MNIFPYVQRNVSNGCLWLPKTFNQPRRTSSASKRYPSLLDALTPLVQDRTGSGVFPDINFEMIALLFENGANPNHIVTIHRPMGINLPLTKTIWSMVLDECYAVYAAQFDLGGMIAAARLIKIFLENGAGSLSEKVQTRYNTKLDSWLLGGICATES
jgi:hypothetical protein